MAKGQKTGGRSKGTPNRVTALVRDRIQVEADPIGLMIRIAGGEEIDGERPTLDQRSHAARWLGAKILPDAKDAPVALDVAGVECPDDALSVSRIVISTMAKGDMSPAEAKAFMEPLTAFLKAYELNELEQRVKALEERQ